MKRFIIIGDINELESSYEDMLEQKTIQDIYERKKHKEVDQVLTWEDPLITADWYFLSDYLQLEEQSIIIYNRPLQKLRSH